jgi:hypothetical protein
VAIALDLGRVLQVVRGEEAEQLLAQGGGVAVVLGDEVDDARVRHVRVGATQRLGGHHLAGDALDDLRAGDEHLGLAGLDDEVGQGRAVGRAAGAGAADEGDLRHGAGEHHVRVEDLAVAGERVDALLHPRAARVVDEDEGGAGLERLQHDLGDLDRVDLARRAARHGEVLAGQVNQPAPHRGRAGDDAVGGQVLVGHAEHGRPVLSEHARLLEAVRVDQGVDALARRQLARLAVLLQLVGAAAQHGLLAALAEVCNPVLHGVGRHGRSSVSGGYAGVTVTRWLRPFSFTS